MRKHLLFVIAAITMILPAASHAEFRYGPTVGIDLTTLDFKQDLISIDQSVGYQAGVQGELMFPGIGFGIDIGLMYTQRGATINFSEKEVWASDGIGDRRSYLHYLEIPIDLRFKWTRMNGLEDYVAPYIFGGPTFSFLAAHNKIDALEYAAADLGVQAGIGFEIMRRWQVQGSYTWGMTYAVKTVKLDDFSARNRTWSLRVSYFF